MQRWPVIRHLEWDYWNRLHVSKHGLSISEAEEALFGSPVVRETYKNRFQFIGPTNRGQFISVIVGPSPDTPGLYYVFSVRPASRKERAFYEQSKSSEEDSTDS